MRPSLRPVAVLATLLPGPALACGQSTHVWVALHALEHLEPGPLADLVAREDVRDLLVHGAMFPDGGYSPLTQDGYGETAHWPPFHDHYLAWQRDRFGGDLSTAEAREHAAFLLGLAAHGIADQIFDGVYLTRSLVYDGSEAWGAYDADLSTDVAMASLVGPQTAPEDTRLPYDTLEALYDSFGQPTAASTMRTGQASLRLAVAFTSTTGANPETAAQYLDQFPWANGHLDDPDVPGSPACIGEQLVAYWQTLFDRLQGGFDLDRDVVVAAIPDDGAFGHVRSASSLESSVSLVFARPVVQDTLAGRVRLEAEDGTEIPVTFRLYYGDRTNVLNVAPTADLVADARHTLTIDAGVEMIDGAVLGTAWSTAFSTAPPPPPAADDAVEGCGCVGAPGPGSALLWLTPLLVARRRSQQADDRLLP